MTGQAEFSEVYLTDVRVPDADRIGDVGDGWRVAMTTLSNERTSIGGGGRAPAPRQRGDRRGPAHLGRPAPGPSHPALRDRLLQLWSAAEVLRLTNRRAGGQPAHRHARPGGLDHQAGVRRR